MRNSEKTTSELIGIAIAELPCDDEASFLRFKDAIVTLQDRGSQDVLEAGRRLCESADPRHRMMGAKILGELGGPDRSFPEECCDRLVRLLREDPEADVVESAIFALGHLGNRRADADVIRFTDHELPAIRHAVAFALVGATDAVSVETLLKLMRDPDERARDWATTAIGGCVEIDGERIRNALLSGTRDADPGVRAEAHAGLARRGDRRGLEGLIAELDRVGRSEQSTNWDYRFSEIARIFLGIEQNEDIADKSILAALKRNAVLI